MIPDLHEVLLGVTRQEIFVRSFPPGTTTRWYTNYLPPHALPRAGPTHRRIGSFLEGPVKLGRNVEPSASVDTCRFATNCGRLFHNWFYAGQTDTLEVREWLILTQVA